MKKITLLFTMLFVASLSYAQSLPLDFEVPEDDAFTGFNGTAASVITDPGDPGNQVLQFVAGTDQWDGAAINLDTYVDLSNDATNTITFEMFVPAGSSNNHLLKFEGGSSGATELFFTTTVSNAWETISVNFGPGLGTEYPTLVIFTDAAAAGGSTTGTYLFDDINGPNGAMVPMEEVPAVAAPVPNTPDIEALSIYNDVPGYTNTWVQEYAFGTDGGETDLDPTAGVNNARRFTLGAAGWGQGRNSVTDITSYNYLQFDYWADSTTVTFTFFLIGNNGVVTEYKYKIGDSGQATITNNAWTHVEIPLSYFTGLGFAKTDFFQWKIDKEGTAGLVHVDNIYFSTNALSLDDLARNSFKAYPNPSENIWTLRSVNNEPINRVQVIDMAGRQVITMEPNSNEVAVDASQLNQGIYFVKIKTDLAEQSIKLVKE